MPTKSVSAYKVSANNFKALFSLTVHRGEGMALLAMDWKKGRPPLNFVGFSIEYQEPGGDKFYALKNRLVFDGWENSTAPDKYSSLRSPFQKFRWVHFPRNPEMEGLFTYRVKPIFMNEVEELSQGEKQEVTITLARETYPGLLNVTFTRGFVASQAFVDKFESKGSIMNLLPDESKNGLTFKPKHPLKDEAYSWMGAEAYHAILEVLDQAYKDKSAKVSFIGYDLSQPAIVDGLKKLKKRARIIIDDSAEHKKTDSGESKAYRMLKLTAGKDNVIRQHMGNLQHNKVIIVNGDKYKAAVCGSTNYSWRGFFVQANNAIILRSAKAVKIFEKAFDDYFEAGNSVKEFGATGSALWQDLGLSNIDAKVCFSPHIEDNAVLDTIAEDLVKKTKSSVLYSLAFMNQTKGSMREAITTVTESKNIFVYGMADKKIGGFDLEAPDGNTYPVFPSELSANVPAPFSEEPYSGKGTRMHHKFIVLDFDTADARVYMGSYNFSNPADRENGENLLLIKDRRIATSYMIEAIRLFDHYHFRVLQRNAKTAKKKLNLKKAPASKNQKPWWLEDYLEPRKIKDRKLFSGV